MTAERDPVLRLLDMLQAARRCIAVVGQGREAFDGDWRVSHLLVHELGVLGEAASGVPDEVRDAHPEVPWAPIRATRNRLVHGYDDIDYESVWNTAVLEVPALIVQIEAIVAELD